MYSPCQWLCPLYFVIMREVSGPIFFAHYLRACFCAANCSSCILCGVYICIYPLLLQKFQASPHVVFPELFVAPRLLFKRLPSCTLRSQVLCACKYTHVLFRFLSWSAHAQARLSRVMLLSADQSWIFRRWTSALWSHLLLASQLLPTVMFTPLKI